MLEIKDLYVSYGNIEALNDISISIANGQIISVIGSNGAGKTSLLNAISGIVKIKSGEISFDKQRLPNKPHQVVKMGIIQVPEGRKIFAGLTVEENLVIGGCRSSSAESKKKMIQMFGIFPILEERRKQLAGTLSGGEQQMLAIARGMMANPNVLLLDEPSLGLAPMIVTKIFNLIKEINSMGITVLLVEQNAFKALSISNYTYVLENGKVVKEGSSLDLLKDPDVRKAYLGK